MVFVPIWKSDEEKKTVLNRIDALTRDWRGEIAFKVDDRDNYRPGWKFNEWEVQGVPVRIEIGPKDLEQEQAVVVRRDTGDKQPVPLSDLKSRIVPLLTTIQKDLYARARKFREESSADCDDYERFKKEIDDPGGFFYVHWCGARGCEDRLQTETKATIRCIPLDRRIEKGACLLCGGESGERVLVAKAY